ncbi:unnamed protein product [Brassicogethes aeneus]|uniref:CIDE-N domain-containing protein n=1 Tax=Brassicogethes aeneus TaxID=1431903 RepID=A0A9P0BLS9_BRAAE|nr:unnamed protein product [Brassicogethes aeneus]
MIVVSEQDVLNNLIHKASEKLQINGKKLVLEKDGTEIDDNEVLLLIKEETLIILEDNEKWMSLGISTPSSTSTETIVSDPSYSEIIPIGINSELTYINNENLDIINMEIINLDSVSNSEYMWNNYQVPWEKIPEHMVKMCERGEKVKYVISEIVHIVIEDLRQIKELIPSKVLKRVANSMCEKYPKMFKDVDNDGIVLADGSCSLYCKLHERASYLRRPHKRRNKEIQAVPPKLIKKKINVMSGCSHWESTTPLIDEDIKKVNLCSPHQEDFYILLEKTYGQQRTFLNNIKEPPTVTQSKNEWPVLFKKEAIEWHFQKLTGKDLNTLPTKIQEKTVSILKLRNKGNQYEDGNWEDSFHFLAKYFKEDITFFYNKVKESEEGNEGNLIKTLGPCVLEIENKNRILVFMEKQQILEVSSSLEGIKLAFGLYYVFNLEYPKETSTLLEFIQRYFLKIHPDSGTRSKKLRASKTKVISLINKLD